MMNQKIIAADKKYTALTEYLSDIKADKIFVVHGNSFYKLPIANFFIALKIPVIHFTDFKPNPDYESVKKGVKVYRENNCNVIIAVGGGSAIDVAKCIKLFALMKSGVDYLQQKILPNNVPLIAVPTTAGTGSESTHFAVIYSEGKKISVADESALPCAIMLDSSALKSLPIYQKKAGLLDALCHALEASWSVHSSDEARAFAYESIRLIYANKDFYLEDNASEICRAYMLYAARLAGMAINLAKTTAGHALSYKLTSTFGISHGHAAALCVARVWKYMNKNLSCAVNEDVSAKLPTIFNQLAACMGFDNVEAAIYDLQKILTDWNLATPLNENFSDEEILNLANSVNVERLGNNPVRLDNAALKNIYEKILKGDF